MNQDELVEFIVESKRNGYAGGNREEKPQIRGSREYSSKKGSLSYRDIWFGNRTFSGIETVFENERAVWGMVYSGGLLDEDGREDRVYAFLKKCLYLVDREAPYRGPKMFTDGTFTYTNEFSGEFEYFMGYENISENDDIIYELHYSGGSIIY